MLNFQPFKCRNTKLKNKYVNKKEKNTNKPDQGHETLRVSSCEQINSILKDIIKKIIQIKKKQLEKRPQ